MIVNSSSGRILNRAAEIELTFKAAGVVPQIIELDETLDDHLKSAFATPDRSLVVAAGGDGTVHSVASKLASTGVLMGVLPLGTRNHFARDLGIPTDLGAAVHTALNGRSINVDVGTVNGRIFVNNASMGIYPRIAAERERRRSAFAPGAWWHLLRATISAFRDLAFIRVRVDVQMTDVADQVVQLSRRTPLLFIGNNEYEIEGSRLGQRQNLDRGTLMLVIAHPHGKTGLMRMAIRAMCSRLRTDKDLDVFLQSRFDVHVHKRHHIRVSLDGEVLTLVAPLQFQSVKSGLRVMVPSQRPSPQPAWPPR